MPGRSSETKNTPTREKKPTPPASPARPKPGVEIELTDEELKDVSGGSRKTTPLI